MAQAAVNGSREGIARFLYIWTHWDTISEDLRKRDERPQAVEEWARRMFRLQQELRDAEQQQLARRLEDDRASLANATLALGIMLYMEEAPGVSDGVLAMVNPELRARLIRIMNRLKVLMQERQRTAGGMDVRLPEP